MLFGIIESVRKMWYRTHHKIYKAKGISEMKNVIRTLSAITMSITLLGAGTAVSMSSSAVYSRSNISTKSQTYTRGRDISKTVTVNSGNPQKQYTITESPKSVTYYAPVINKTPNTGQSPQTVAMNNLQAAENSRSTGGAITSAVKPTGVYTQSATSQAVEKVLNFFGYKF